MRGYHPGTNIRTGFSTFSVQFAAPGWLVGRATRLALLPFAFIWRRLGLSIYGQPAWTASLWLTCWLPTDAQTPKHNITKFTLLVSSFHNPVNQHEPYELVVSAFVSCKLEYTVGLKLYSSAFNLFSMTIWTNLQQLQPGTRLPWTTASTNTL